MKKLSIGNNDCIEIMKTIVISKEASLIDFGCGHYTLLTSKVVQEEEIDSCSKP